MWWILLVGAGVCCLVWALIEARWFTVRTVRVPLVPQGSEALRILHLSDLHLVPRQRRKIRWVRGLVHRTPDFVVLTGDNLGDARSIPILLDALRSLEGIPGVFVYGSHDYEAPRPQNPFSYFAGPTKAKPQSEPLPTEQLTEGLERLGWENLNNSRASFRIKGTEMQMVGVDDPHVHRDRMPASTEKKAGIRLGAAHAPYSRVLSSFREDGVELAFAGHTHGGQVRVPWIGALVTNCDLDRRQARGLSRWPRSRQTIDGESLWLHVSAGAGTSPFAPIRFFCRPEATIVELVSRQDRPTARS